MTGPGESGCVRRSFEDIHTSHQSADPGAGERDGEAQLPPEPGIMAQTFGPLTGEEWYRLAMRCSADRRLGHAAGARLRHRA